MKLLRTLGLVSLALVVALTLLVPRDVSAGSGLPGLMPDNPPGDRVPVGSGDPQDPTGTIAQPSPRLGDVRIFIILPLPSDVLTLSLPEGLLRGLSVSRSTTCGRVAALPGNRGRR